MNVHFFLWSLILLLPSQCFGFFSSKFIIHNQTNQTLFFAPYHQQEFPQFKAEQITEPIAIEPGQITKIKKPDIKFFYTRNGIISFNKPLLKENLTHREYVNLEHFSIGVTAAEVFIVKQSGSLPYIDNTFNKATETMKKILSKTLYKKPENPDESIQVRLSNDLCEQEKNFIQKREKKVKKALEKILGTLEGENIPHITVMGSGGGYRALIGYWSALDAFNTLGLWDTFMHASGVSGSTWLLSALYGSQEPFENFTSYIQPRLAKNLLKQDIYKSKPVKELLYQKDDFTLVDAWGMLIGKALLDARSSTGLDIKLSDFADATDNANMPLYLCSAVHRGMETVKWFEYTPYEVGSIDYAAYIPAQYAGARFKNGVCIDPAFKEYPLALHCGVFGSAFAVDAKRAVEEINNKFLDLIVLKTRLSGLQLAIGSLTNFMKGIEQTGMSKSKYLKLVDAGYHINIPMPICIRRKPDIIIVVNVVENAEKDSAPALKQAIEDAEKRGYAMPAYDPTGIHDKPVTILRPKNNYDAPIIIYVPNIYQPYSTLKLEYTEKEFNALYRPMKNAIIENKDIFYDVYKEVWKKKNTIVAGITEVATKSDIPQITKDSFLTEEIATNNKGNI